MPLQKNYFTKKYYQCHKTPVFYDDNEEDSLTYQLDVYRYAAEVLQEQSARSVLDIGCGYGLKLKEFILPHTSLITGVDESHAINFCQTEHAFGNWHVINIEGPAPISIGKYDLIISADVIEHLVDPDTLLDMIRECSTPGTKIILSTPERDLRRGKDSMGPPQNPAHIREWNKEEFAEYLISRDLNILAHTIMNLKEGMPTCQTVLCELN